MPVYVYACEACEHQFEKIQKMSDKPLKRCPECKKHRLHKIPQAFHGAVVQEPTTVYHQAQRNTEKMGHYEREEIIEQDPIVQARKRRRAQAPPWRPDTVGPKKKVQDMVNKNDQKAIQDYIENG